VAIKGKGKTRPRPATRAPRREPVPVPVPWFRRRWVQVLAAFVAGVLVMTAFVWATNSLRDERASSEETAEQLQERAAAQTWLQQVESQLNTVGQLTGGAPPQVQPDLEAAIRDLSKGTPVGGAEDTAKSAQTATKAAADALDAFALSDTIRDKGFDPFQASTLADSKEKLVAGLRGYHNAARLLELSLSAQGQLAEDLLAQAKDELAQAKELVGSAWSDLETVLKPLGLLTGSASPGSGALGGALPGTGGS
jgi:hypothetical protein